MAVPQANRSMDLGAYDVVVIGAGPAGSSAAAALAACGRQVLLVERDRFPRHKVCGEFLSPEAQGTLTALGLTDVLAEQGPTSLTHVEIATPGGQRLRRPLPAAAWGISRYALDGALAQAAAAWGVTLWTATTALRTTRQQDSYRVTLRRDGQHGEVTARVVLLAAGRQVRAALCPHPTPRTTQEGQGAPLSRAVGLKRHLEGVPVSNQVELFLFPGGYAGINPVEGGRTNLCLLVEEKAFRAAGGQVDRMFAAAEAANPALAERLAGARPVSGTTCTVGAVNTQTPPQLWAGLPRLGDAALMLPPLCGDGMAMALRGAELCAAGAEAYLRGDCSLAEWKTDYTEVWRTEFSKRVQMAHTLQRLLMAPSLAGGLVKLGSWLPWAADYVVRATRGALTAPDLPDLSSPVQTGQPTA